MEFFAAIRHSEIKIPKQSQLVTWDTDILCKFIKTTWPTNDNLSLHQLQLKTLTLICLATIGRPRSDVGRLQYNHIQFTTEGDRPISVIIHFTEAKETQVKSTQLWITKDPESCPTTTLFAFIQRTRDLRSGLPPNHTLFLTYLDQEQKTSGSVKPSTVASWLSKVMDEAGIDTSVYKAHSIRAASSTKAVEKGHTIQSVKQHANWSQQANTFEKYYYKPIAQESESSNIANSIFSVTENHTTPH